jgi:hypothetical protein
VAHTGVTIGLRHPVEDRLCGRLELARELLRCAPGLEQFHHLRPEFRRVRRTSLAHFGNLLTRKDRCPFWRVNFSSLMDLVHRGRQISEALTQRRAFRRRRRGANLRYRAPRFDNRTRAAGWLVPSLEHRVDSTMSWVWRVMRWAPVSELSVELVRFDMQAVQNPQISGVEYQQGERWRREFGQFVKWKSWGVSRS